MPVAANVAGGPPHLSPVTGCKGGDALQCPFRAGQCPALQELFGSRSERIASEEAVEWVQRLRPCGSCQTAFEGGRASLRGLRLGQREREVLLGALETEAFPVTTKGMTRAMSAARRRAALSLTKAGLVAAAPVRAKGNRATVCLTPLGRYVMAAYGRFITKGKPVRWDRPSSKVPLPGRNPASLLSEAAGLAQGALRETLLDLNKVLIAAVARPVRDPAALDAVTQHLERKAEVLRELIEPRPAAPALPLAEAS